MTSAPQLQQPENQDALLRGELDRYRFIARLDNAIRHLLDREEVTHTAASLLGRHLGADRCAYAWVDGEEAASP